MVSDQGTGGGSVTGGLERSVTRGLERSVTRGLEEGQ